MSQRLDTIRYSTSLVVEECYSCHILFAMPSDLQARALRDHSISFYCPLGHSQGYIGKTAEQKARERAEGAEARETMLRDQLHASERSKAALKGVVTRTKRRVGKGVCPCCNRTFAALAAHMEAKHPDYAE